MQNAFLQLITQAGEDPLREGLIKTPERAAKAFEFLTSGYRTNLEEITNEALFKSTSNTIVMIRHIEMYSMCEHHLLPFIGQCHIGYIPNGKVLGVSKFARIVDMFSRRLQIQENLTTQIATAIQDITGAEGVGVVIEAKHLCMMMRGVEKQNSIMSTTSMLGSFDSNANIRHEFLQLISSST
jgi:GTP cyclohydrolase I